MGKGGCFNFVEQSIEFVRGVICCACCMITIGPILLIVGLVLLTKQNNYDNYVSQYNTAVSNFNANVKGTMTTASGYAYNYGSTNTVSLTSLQYTTTAPYTNGNTLPTGTGINSGAVSVALGSTSSVELAPVSSSGTTYAVLSVAQNNRSTQVTIPAPVVSSVTRSVYCSSYDQNHRRLCRDICNEMSPSGCTATYTGLWGDTCYSSSSCSSCRWSQTQSAFCTTVAVSNTSGFSTGSKSSCMYPFSSSNQPMSCSSSVYQKVYFLSDQDPVIQAQVIAGSADMSFGLTAGEQRNLGLALTGIGAAITGLMVFTCYAIYKAANSDEKTAAHVYGAFGRQPPMMQTTNYYAPAGSNTVQFQAGGVPYQQQPGYSAAPPGTVIMVQQQPQYVAAPGNVAYNTPVYGQPV